MKILVFTLEFPPMLGGAGTYSYELSLGLNQLGHDVTILTSNREVKVDKEEIDLRLEEKGISIKRRRWFNGIWFMIWPIIFKKEIKYNEYDIVIFANQGSIIVGSRLSNIPYKYICTLHGSERYTFLGARYGVKGHLIYDRHQIINFLNRAEKIVCVSKSLFDDIILIYPEFPLEIIPLGISDMFKRQDVLYPNRNIIVCTARFVPDKGQDTILRACHKLVQEGFNFTLFLVGSGTDESRLKSLVSEYGLLDYVDFRGILSREQLAELYNGVDLFVLISRYKETFGLAYLEAMLSGIPVIGSNLGAVPDIIIDGYNGYLVDDNNVDQLVLHIKNALNKQNELGANAIKTAKEYSNIKMAKKHLI